MSVAYVQVLHFIIFVRELNEATRESRLDLET